MNTMIDLMLSLFLITSSPILWVLVAVAAVCAIGLAVSAKGYSDAKKGEKKANEAKKQPAKEQKVAETQPVQEQKQEQEPVQEQKQEPISFVSAQSAEDEAVEQDEQVQEEAQEITADEEQEEVAQEPVQEQVQEEVAQEEQVQEEPVQEQPEEVVEEPVQEEQPEEAIEEPVQEEVQEEQVEESVEEPEQEQVAEQEVAEEVTPDGERHFSFISNQVAEDEVEEQPVQEEVQEQTLVADVAPVKTEEEELAIQVDQQGGFVWYNGYRRSFESKLIQSKEEYKGYYSELKNKLLSYKKIHNRLSWSCESFRLGRKLEAKLIFRGRTLCLCVALVPEEYPENIYHQRNLGDKKKYAEVPMMVRVRSKLGLKRACNLIEILMEKEGVALNAKYEVADYSNVAYEPDSPLIDRGLIKIVLNKRAVVVKEGETEEQAYDRVIEEIKEAERQEKEEDDVVSPEEQAEELEYTVDEEQQFIYYTIYRRSFESRLIQSKDAYKNYYSRLKNALLSYKKVRSRISWSCESFRFGRELKAKLTYRGKTLCLFLALDPEKFPDNVYHQRNMGNKKKYAEVPMMVRVRSELACKRAIELIAKLMEVNDIVLNPKYQAADYSDVAYEPDAPLIERKLIKLGKGKRSIILKDGETEEQAVQRTVEEIKQAEREEEDEEDQIQYTVDEEQKFVFYTLYRRSFESRLIQAKEESKGYYSQIKNELVSYRKIHARTSWACESFRLGRELKAKLAYRGKTLCLYLALNPEDYPENIYHQRNVGDKKKFAAVPLMVRVRSNLGLKRAIELVKVLMTIDDTPKARNFTEIDYSTIPYEEDAPLIERKLIKLAQGKRAIVVSEGETTESAVQRTVEEIKQQNKKEKEADEAEEQAAVPAQEETPAQVEEQAPEFVQQEEVQVAPEEVKEDVPEFAEQTEQESQVVPQTVEDEAVQPPEFVEQQEEVQVAPQEVESVEQKVPEFAEQQESEEIPQTVEDAEQQPLEFVQAEESQEIPEQVQGEENSFEFAEQQEKEQIAPSEVADEPNAEFDFVSHQTAQDAPQEVEDVEQEIPDFQLNDQDGQAPEFARQIQDGQEVPDFAAEQQASDEQAPQAVEDAQQGDFEFASAQQGEEVVPDVITDAQNDFVPSFDAPTDELQGTNAQSFTTPEEAFLAFTTPDESIGAAPTRLDVVSDVGPVIPKDIEKAQLEGVSDDLFAQAPAFLEGGSVQDQAPVVPAIPTKDLFGRPLPKGLYDEVPMKKKKVEQKEEPERVIPTGELSEEDAKMVAETQAQLDALLAEEEEETTINEDDEAQYEIVGTAEDISNFTAFENKLLLADNKIKYFYSEIKNTILSYKLVKCKGSNAGDSFRQGGNLIARITYNNNKLRLHLCLNPKAYSVKTYNHYSLKNVAQYQEVPFTLEILSRKDLLNATKLIQDAMASKFIIYTNDKKEYVDYAAMYTLKKK